MNIVVAPDVFSVTGFTASLCSFPMFGKVKMMPFKVNMMPDDGCGESVSALDSTGQGTFAHGKP